MENKITPEEQAREAYLRRHVRDHIHRYRIAADMLLERLLIDGMEQRIQVEDLEALALPERRAAFMRKIVIELMLCLRIEK